MKTKDYFCFGNEIDGMTADEFAALIVAKSAELGGAKISYYDGFDGESFGLEYEREETLDEALKRMKASAGPFDLQNLSLLERKIAEAQQAMKDSFNKRLYGDSK